MKKRENKKECKKFSEDFKVLIIGPYPGKIGGVSTFVKRLYKVSMPGVEKFVLNTQNFSIPQEKVYSLVHFFWLIRMADLVHINVSNLNFCFLFSFIAKILNRKIIVQFNSARFEIQGIKKLQVKLILSMSNGIIAVNNEIKRKFIAAFPSAYRKITVIRPFIKPSFDSPPLLPVEIMDLRNRVSKLLVANASKIVFYRGRDLYGLGLSIDMFNMLISQIPDVGFVFVVSEFTEEMQEVLKEKRLHKNFLVYEGPVDFISLLKVADIFVRPTFSDGDSLSVREALCVGVPTIASNVVERPESVILFDINNTNDYLNKVIDVLKNIDFYSKKFSENARKQSDYTDEIKNFYYKLLKMGSF